MNERLEYACHFLSNVSVDYVPPVVPRSAHYTRVGALTSNEDIPSETVKSQTVPSYPRLVVAAEFLSSIMITENPSIPATTIPTSPTTLKHKGYTTISTQKTRAMFSLTCTSSPFMIYSLLPNSVYNTTATPATHNRYKDDDDALVSYGACLRAAPLPVSRTAAFLDDPKLTSGRHRVVMNLPSLMESVIAFVTAEQLRDEINHVFRQNNPWIDPSMSLTKIRKIKTLFVSLCPGTAVVRATNEVPPLDISTAAYASIYFEMLVVKDRVVKSNRMLIGATCMLLAVKFNEYGVTKHQHKLRLIISELSLVFGVRKADLLRTEFHVLTSLNFDLHLRLSRVRQHMEHLAKLNNLS